MTLADPSAPQRSSDAADGELEGLFRDLLEQVTRRRGSAPSLREWNDLTEAWRIVHALRVRRGNRSAAARELGIGRRTLYTKMEKLGIAESWDSVALQGGRIAETHAESEEARRPAAPRLLHSSDPLAR